MKNNKKLVVLAGAAALGLVAATGVTSGFAWFAVNTSVSATSLNVKAKTNASYLLINNTDAVAGTPVTTITGIDPANATTGVAPVAKAATEFTVTDNGLNVTVHQGDWYTATIEERDSETGTYTNVISDIVVGNDSYFVGYDFYLYLASGSEAQLTNETLTVTADFGSSHASVKAVVSVDGGSSWSDIVYNADNHKSVSFSNQTLKVPAASPASSDFLNVKVELFIDGTVTGVKSTATISDLAGEIGLTFAI